MGKFTNIKRLSKTEQEELFIKFARCLSSLKSPVEAANLIKDLLSEQEAIMLARRLQIADLLSQRLTYSEIHRVMKVGDNTIAKVQLWLSTYGEGFRAVLERTREKSGDRELTLPWRQLKKSYPMYFWPQLLLEELLKSANKKEKQRLLDVIKKMKEKTVLSKQIAGILQN